MIKKLLHIEKIKTLNYGTFRTIILLHAILFLLVISLSSSFQINIQGITLEKLFHFPHVWNTLAWFASWFNLLLGILAITLVTNEFQFRTFRKQLIDGLSRNELLVGKLLVLLSIAAYTMLLVFVTGMLFGIIKTPAFNIGCIIDGLSFLPVLYVQALGYMLLAMLFAFIFRNTAFSIVAFILYFFPVEPILRAFLPDTISKFMPVKIISNLTPMPDFVGISLEGVVQLPNSVNVSGLNGLTQANATLPFYIMALSALIYCLVFLAIIKVILKIKNF
jgi:ABC-2 type transport system permease protein